MRQIIGFLTSALAAAVLTIASPAFAQGDGMSVAEVAAALGDSGLSPEIDGETIYGSGAGLSFSLDAYNCSGEPARCNEFLFSASFATDAAVTLDTINAFNAATLAGRGYLSGDGTPTVEHLFTLGADDRALVDRNISIWMAVMREFAETIGFYGAAGS